MRNSTKRKLIKAIDLAVQALEIKCGGRGGTPGPCPGSGKPKPAGVGKKPPKDSPKKPPKKPATPPKKPTASDRIDPKNPKPKIKPSELTSAGIKVKNGQLAISKPKTFRQAVEQVDLIGKIHAKAMSMSAAASKLPKTDPMRMKVLMAAAHVDRQYIRVLANAKRMAYKKSTDGDQVKLRAAIEAFEKVHGVLPDWGEDKSESIDIPISSAFVEIGE